MLTQHIKVALLVLPLLGASGCALLGPELEVLQPSALPSTWDKVDKQLVQQDALLWWQQFNDATLNSLIEQANRQNLDIEAAGLRILQARLILGISDALNYPQVQVASGNLAKIYQNQHSFNQAALSFDAAWEMDIWGKYARGIESSAAALYASIASYKDISVTISAEVARNYINFRTFQERMLLSQSNIEIQQRVVVITQIQFDSGNVTELDVQQAKSQLYSTQAALPALKLGMMQARNALAVLLAVLPEEILVMLDSAEVQVKVLAYKAKYGNAKSQRPSMTDNRVAMTASGDSIVPQPPVIDSHIDASLVMRRPDIEVAERLAQAQSAKIGIAEAALYPSFSLFGAIGVNSTRPSGSSFSLSDSLTLSAGPSFSWNIFQYGKVKNNIRLEDARLQESLINYNKTVLVAVREVSSALESYSLFLEQQQFRLQSVNSAIRAFNISMTQYENGQIGFERLLNSVQKMTRSEDSYAQVKGDVANQVVALYKSLGGGWQVNTGRALISERNIEQMQSRTDWGDELQAPIILPDVNANALAGRGQE